MYCSYDNTVKKKGHFNKSRKISFYKTSGTTKSSKTSITGETS